MKIALLGYGKMGKLTESIAKSEGWEVGPILDIDSNPGGSGITRDSMQGVQVAIDFSQPDTVLSNIDAAARAGVNLVVGTTGWLKDISQVERTVLEAGIGLVYGANFSIGMNLFFELATHAAQIVSRIPQYDPYLAEEHHSAKKDAPSGTALKILELMKPYLNNPNPSIACTRAGFIPGTHVVGFDSEADTILIEHRARNRKGFAEGAILAARWINGKQGFYDFRHVFREALGLG
jgi:4-hydroxy-tetrahydrodipicolinate reductase